jgi:hypothetical protein
VVVNVLPLFRWPVFSRPSLAGFGCPPRLFPNDFPLPVFLVPFSGSETEKPGSTRNPQGSGRSPRFLPPNSPFLW